MRKYSLDELPQLLNIIKGDIVFVGPRPALYNQYDLIDLRSKSNIHLLMPGITGWSQINGRDNLTVEQKVELDRYYLKNKSFSLNFIIIIKTFIQLIKPKGIAH
jgi:Sugar transferases involved in lipopolysaccharide synthesis